MKEEKRGRKSVPTINEKVNKYTKGGSCEYRFNYNTVINNKAVIDNRWELDIIDIAIFETIKGIILYLESPHNLNSNKPLLPVPNKDGNWYPVPELFILKQCPLLPLSSWSTVYKRITKLVNCGLIERNPSNMKSREKLIRLGKEAHKMDTSQLKDCINDKSLIL